MRTPTVASSLRPSWLRRQLCRLVACEGAGGFALEVEVRLVADVDRDAKDRAAGKGAGVLVLFGDVVAAVEADAQSIPRV